MRERLQDPFYEVLKHYDRLVLEYFLLEDESAGPGIISHKAAVLYAMQRL